MNALLSFGYMLVLGEAIAAIQARGLHTGLGFLHEVSNRRPALALDLLEIFRQPIVDRLTLSLVNRCVLIPEDFQNHPDGGALLKPEALRRYLPLYERMLSTPFRHPRSERSITFCDLVREEAGAIKNALRAGTVWNPIRLEL